MGLGVWAWGVKIRSRALHPIEEGCFQSLIQPPAKALGKAAMAPPVCKTHTELLDSGLAQTWQPFGRGEPADVRSVRGSMLLLLFQVNKSLR